MRVSVHGFAMFLSPGLGWGACWRLSSHLQSACFLEFPCLLTRMVLTWKLAAIPLRSPVSSVENALLSPTGTREACWFGVAPRTLERGEGRRTPRWDLPLEFVHSPAFGKYRKENWVADLGSVLILSSVPQLRAFLEGSQLLLPWVRHRLLERGGWSVLFREDTGQDRAASCLSRQRRITTFCSHTILHSLLAVRAW